MEPERKNPFASAFDDDLIDAASRATAPKTPIPKAVKEQFGEVSGFPSREARPPRPAKSPVKWIPDGRRQVCIKAPVEVIERFEALRAKRRQESGVILEVLLDVYDKYAKADTQI